MLPDARGLKPAPRAADTGPIAAPSSLHDDALALVEDARPDEARALLREAVAKAVEPDLVNDLAVLSFEAGELGEARSLLELCLIVDPAHADARENLGTVEEAQSTAPIAGAGGSGQAPWRSSQTLGGPDVALPERAYPGMPSSSLMSEHASRYALALVFAGGRHVLDLGCGTGYGSEMLTWSAASVRGFDLWRPGEHERPAWPGGAQLHYGHDLCRDDLPSADMAVMFEVIEHLVDAPGALRRAWSAAPFMVASFPNPVFHGSHRNPHHVNDWSFERFSQEVADAAAVRNSGVRTAHFHQTEANLIAPGADPEASYWLVVAQAA